MFWYEKFGWTTDPFSMRPSENLVALDKEKNTLLNFLHSGTIALITGPTGAGKTSLLLWVEKQLIKTQFTSIAMNCVEDCSKETILRKIKSCRRIQEKILFKKYPRNAILLLDEAQNLSRDAAEELKLLWDSKKIHSIALTSIESNLSNVTGSFTDRFRGQVIAIPSLSSSNVRSLIKQRVGEKNPFDSAALSAIVERSHKIPRRVLELCRTICINAADKGITKIARVEVLEFLPPVKFDVAEQPFSPQEVLELEEKTTSVETEDKRQRDRRQKRQETITKETKKTTVSQQETTLGRSLSPAQTEIVKILFKKEATAEELVALMDAPIGSIRKQLSRLKAREIITIADLDRSPITYRLTDTYIRTNIRE
jgi:type II secretory pathway predicted ATPase ExeA